MGIYEKRIKKDGKVYEKRKKKMKREGNIIREK